MADLITCPHCGKSFEAGAAMRHKLERELRGELAAELERRIDEERRRVAEAATAKEVELMRLRREIEDRQQALALEVERRVTEEAGKIRKRSEELAAERAEQHRLRLEELEQKSAGMRKTIDELQRKAQQGSEQAQGEAQEEVLKNLLERAFPRDQLSDVPKGEAGADLLHTVRDELGNDCGKLVWESKRTKAWSDGWLPKIRADQRAAGADLAVLVSQALPGELRTFGQRDGVWIAGWSLAVPLAAVLRAGAIAVAAARRAAEGRGEKTAMLFDYLTGSGFRNRVSGLVEALHDMESDLRREKLALSKSWRARERQLGRAFENLSALFGDVQGIAGRQLADLELLSLPEPEVEEENVALLETRRTPSRP